MMSLDQARKFVASINNYVDVTIKVTELKATQEEHEAAKREMVSFITSYFYQGQRELAEVINEYTNVSLAVRELKASQDEHAEVKGRMSKMISVNVMPSYG